MDIKWTDDGDGTKSARVGSVILLVTPRDGGVWTAQIQIKYGTVDDATFACSEDAIRWCGRRLPEIVDPLVATARAEAALAEREAIATDADVRHRAAALEMVNFCEDDPGYTRAESAACEYEDFARAIRARTTPATLSTETLAAIAEARGLRVVEPELLAGLEPPVLRWENNDGHWSAFIGPWRVTASEGSWMLCVVGGERGGRAVIDFGRKSDLRDNRLAAEAALRSLGVPFVVEEGGAL